MKARSVMGAGSSSAGYPAPANDANFFKIAQGFESDSTGSELKLRVVHPADISEVLSSVEDVWLRLVRLSAMHAAVLSDASTGTQLVMFRFDGDEMDPECCQLLETAASVECYWWRQDGRRGSLARDIQMVSNTLVIELAPMHQMVLWPQGQALQWSVLALLQRIKILGAHEKQSGH